MKVEISRKLLRCSMFLLVGTALAAAQSSGKTTGGAGQPQSLAVDWRQQGVAGNLSVDDTPAMNRAVAEQKQAGGGEFNWPNRFLTRVSAALNASNTSDLTFRGTGPTSGLVYCGDGTQPVFDLDHGHTIEILELSIFGHWGSKCPRTPARAGISWDSARAGNWTATNLLVDRVHINSAPQGDIGTPDFTCIDISAKSQVNVEDGKFYNIVCHPHGGIGFHIGPSANPKNEIFFNNNVSFGQYGYKFEGGGYHIQYGECGFHSEACLYLAGANDPASVDGLLSEGNKQFVRLGPHFGHHPITLSHINNGWDDKATAPCFWDIGGAEFLLAFSNTWSDTKLPIPHSLCGDPRSSGIFLNNSFAWKLGNTSTSGFYSYLPPPADLLQLLGGGYAFHGGGQIALGTIAAGANNGVWFIQTSGSLRSGLRYSTDASIKTGGALPVAANHAYLGDGVLEIAGPGAPQVQPGCSVTGGDTSQQYGVWLFALDAAKRRTAEGHAFGCHGPKLPAIDSQHTFSLQWTPQPEAASYDVVLMADGAPCFLGNTTGSSLTVRTRPACNNYNFPKQNEAEYIKTRGRGIWGFGPSSESTPTWFIDTASGSASFSGALHAPKLQGITDTSVVANLNADRVDGKRASDFTAAPVAVPKAPNSACTAGNWAHDANYMYVCVSTNTWRRTALSAW